ncbi:two-component system, AgrA family, sensor histidine kinase AgrC [Evansella caseinilytica]|uniref:Two-component system, AgrA family, sensor histidine kinase AgrC n=1 Tax=Evansella caseinilytica TaxID=1503961 RepID=A0A1H3V0W2_9BACI|nr:GHKL domain-containing protein [Evansella caseinilytica]SDZ68257.1 two-component system, AgrA family, sensor histidine kinase AgrC [Evansella caseinilytica]
MNIRPGFKHAAVIIGLIGIPTVSFYFLITEWAGLVYLFVSAACVFYSYTKTPRVLLDLFMLAIAGIISKSLIQSFRFSIFSAETPVVIWASIGLYLLCFAFAVWLYCIFIKKIWNSILIPVAGQLLIITIACITVTVLYMNLFISLSNNLYSLAMFNLVIEIIYFILMFILSVILLRNNKKENLLKQKEAEQEQLFQYMQALEQINKDMQSFRHDYQNILLTMQGYITQNDMEGLKTYFNDHIVKVEERVLQNNYVLNQLENIKLVELKGLLSTKVLLGGEANIHFNIEVPDKILAVDMNILDLTRMLGILVDNAVEAAIDSEDRQLNLALLQKTDGSMLIVVENRIGMESLNIEQLFTAGYSTKGKDRGTGLATVRKIVNQYSNITMNTSSENGIFVHEIEINAVVPKRKKFLFSTESKAFSR